ncbi:sensory neuron membrane protein 2-like isoform X1 [Hylaeus anthracinus]|uniref:sensory neuron membrane protein 2-like isoform X1 n=1 Tax=Hylaeus anthracinus TaxID=313031 RepID=UPI0023B973F5|nr:sensory neuron membrane protein 2-like isoform X1 [Hylaeus anthracinus]
MIFYGVLGVILILLGIIVVVEQYMVQYITYIIQKKVNLVDGTAIYESWRNPIPLQFTCYLFNVTNPDDVMRGENPNLVEYGPFTYDETFEKQVIDIDEENDEITYTTRSTFAFNKRQSLNVTSHNKVTILNPAYIGTISMLATLPPNFMEKYGDHIPKLFPNRSSIFLKARPTDLLFNGVKVSCNTKKFPELNLICKTMESKPPPVLRRTENEGAYLLSFFQRVNGTIRGPFTINRGLKNISLLGDTTAYMEKRMLDLWYSESCNKVRGTDTILWAPLVKPISSVASFSPDMCRSLDADYVKEVTIHGVKGSKFALNERAWFLNESQCYCPRVNDEIKCLPQGLLDTSECQKLPVVSSEPHFLHGDPELLTYARGLKPDKDLHETFIIIEHVSGAPISGNKASQVNLKLTRQPVELLANVSEGYFPILWCKSGGTLELVRIPDTYQLLRLLQLIRYLQYLPLTIGIYILLLTGVLWGCAQRKLQTSNLTVEEIFVSSNLQTNSVVRRPPRRPTESFDRLQRVYPAF